MKTETDILIRWLIRRDMPEVLQIESESFECPWSDEDFMACLLQRNCIGMVAECCGSVVGFMIYELHKTRLNLLSIAVARDVRRCGVGSRMIARLVDKLSTQRRRDIVVEVRERNLDAQLFFREQRFRAVKVLRSCYDDTDEDTFAMRYRLKEENQ